MSNQHINNHQAEAINSGATAFAFKVAEVITKTVRNGSTEPFTNDYSVVIDLEKTKDILPHKVGDTFFPWTYENGKSFLLSDATNEEQNHYSEWFDITDIQIKRVQELGFSDAFDLGVIKADPNLWLHDLNEFIDAMGLDESNLIAIYNFKNKKDK